MEFPIEVDLNRSTPSVSRMAKATLALGILSLFGFTIILGIPAIFLGSRVLGEARKNSVNARWKGMANAGMLMGFLGSLVWPLVIVGVPLVLDANDRAKVSRPISEMLNISLGLGAYFIDYQCYPPSLTFLTTPVTYLAGIPEDHFLRRGVGFAPYDYAFTENNLWILRSVGPDKVPEIILSRLLTGAENAQEVAGRFQALEFDPSNGIISKGDIFLAGP